MSIGNQAPPQFSADGRWWWDGYRWVPASSPVKQPISTGSGWKWARRIVSAVIGLLTLLVLIVFLLAAAFARPIDPVQREGTLTKFVADCHVPGDVADQCAYLDIDQFCYRIAPDQFQPALPDLSLRVGQPIVFVVDRDSYEGAVTIGDPFCNFQVARVVVTDNGVQKSYSTNAMTEPELAGHSVGQYFGLALIPTVVLLLLAGWNVRREWRLRRR